MSETSCEKNRRRALRRHRLERAKRRAFAVAKLMFTSDFYWRLSAVEINEMRRRAALHRYRNRASCSCAMCGNPRRSLLEKQHLTLGEKRALISYREQVIEPFRGA
jgi:hypothetical protein